MKKIYLFVLLAIVSVSCSSVDYTLVPSEISRKPGSHLFAETKADDVTFTARYSHKRENDVFFDIEIYNDTDVDFHLYPRDFYYIPCEYYPEKAEKVCYDIPVPAFDPNKERHLIKAAYKDSKDDEKIEKTVIGATYGLSLLGAVFGGGDSGDKAAKVVGSTAGAAGTYAAVDREYKEYREYLDNEMIFWTKTAVNDTVIAPGKSIKGKIGFPYEAGKYDFYKVFLPTSEGDLMLEFKTVEIKD